MPDLDRVPTPAEQLAGTMFAPLPRQGRPASAVQRELDQVHPPLAKLENPETSHAAARRYADEAKLQNAAIYWALVVMGPAGGDCYAIAERLNAGDPAGPWDHVIVARRLAGLRQRRLLWRLVATSEGTAERPHDACHIHVAAEYRSHYTDHQILPEPERRRKKAA